MWELKPPQPVKILIGILASDEQCLAAARAALARQLGPADLLSDIWPFTDTTYYCDQTGPHILRQFVSLEEPADPSVLADIKHQTNRIEQELAATLGVTFPRPANLDPGLIEPSKLVLATTKNFAHRIYIGKKMYAEVTLVFDKGAWRPLPYTYPDYRQPSYGAFFSQVREKLLRQLRSATHEE